MLFKSDSKKEVKDLSLIAEYSIGSICTRQKVDITRDIGGYRHGPRIKIQIKAKLSKVMG